MNNEALELAKTCYTEFIQPRNGCSCTFEELPKHQREMLLDSVGYVYAVAWRSVLDNLEQARHNTPLRLGASPVPRVPR